MATICQHHVIAAMHGIRQRKLSERQLLERAGINPTLLTQKEQRIYTDQVARLFKIVQESLNDEFMGLTETPCKVGLFATMAELVSRCTTLGELLEKAVGFYNLITNDIRMKLIKHRNTAIVDFEMNKPELDPEHFMTEFWLVIWHRFPSWYIGEPIRLQETHFAFSVPSHHSELLIMFPSHLQFDSPSNQLVFDAQYLEKPLIRSYQALEAFIQNAPADVMTIPGSDSTFESQIERMIKQNPSGQLVFPSIHSLANDLGTSVQTLRRRLKESGTSYQKIKDDLRRETAIRKLTQEGLSVENVSELVGFSEPRSFSRAFKHWTGLSPREYCKQYNR